MSDRQGQPIFLIGYRGAGKSTVARELAARLGYESIDADEMLEARTGKSIAAIFADSGEAVFRDAEAQIVAELCDRLRIVAALGGGSILRETNRNAIRAAGPIVWLTASVDTILKRIAADHVTASRRPDLTAAGGRDEVERLLAARTPLYLQCATLVVDTEDKSAAELADEILANL
jgi:shikimate kinase